ncbi:MAG: hypothetical protein ABSG91_24935 [Syntrophobacteraceae bacterium]|jgi:hypothetical protein
MMKKSQWHSVPTINGTLFSLFDAEFSKLGCTYEQILPDFREARTPLLGTDYSGESSGAPYWVYSILITSLESWANWEPIRLHVRNEYLSDLRRMSFKRLTDGQRRRALLPLLQAANSLDGLSFSVAVNKQCESIFAGRPPLDLKNPQFAPYRKWKANILERAFFIVHTLSVLIAGLAVPGQNVMWFADEDSIAANDERVRELTHIFAWISSLYLTFDLGHFRCGNSKCDDGARQIEDFLAVPDLIAGSIAEQMALKAIGPTEETVAKLFTTVKSKLAYLG